MTSKNSTLSERLTYAERELRWPNQKPKDAATLILIDRTGEQPKILMGLRHANHKFMPNKFVFPGGRLDVSDRFMPVFGTLSSRTEEALMKMVSRPTQSRARALALTAIRETFEETGLLLGTKEAGAPQVKNEAWQGFEEHGVFPNLENLQFVARAITPPKRPKRFDTRFFALDANEIAHKIEGIIHPEAELVELKWLTFEEALKEDMPTITQVILEELQLRIANGFSPNLPIPFFRSEQKKFKRYEL